MLLRHPENHILLQIDVQSDHYFLQIATFEFRLSAHHIMILQNQARSATAGSGQDEPAAAENRPSTQHPSKIEVVGKPSLYPFMNPIVKM